MKTCQSRIYGAEFSQDEIAVAVRENKLLSMEMEFNKSCNFRCLYCYASDNTVHRNELSKHEFLDLINQAKELGARKIIVLGGEPMLYPPIIEMIQYIRGLDMDVELFTNGTNITREMAQTLYTIGVRVVLKMNTFEQKIQDMLSGRKGAYAQIHEAFNNLKQAGYPSADRFMGISTVICQQNIDELPKMWEWLRDQNIAPYFEMITPQGGAKEHNMLEVDSRQVEELVSPDLQDRPEKIRTHLGPQASARGRRVSSSPVFLRSQLRRLCAAVRRRYDPDRQCAQAAAQGYSAGE